MQASSSQQLIDSKDVVVALSAAHAWTVLSFHSRQQPTTTLIMGGHDLTFPRVPINMVVFHAVCAPCMVPGYGYQKWPCRNHGNIIAVLP